MVRNKVQIVLEPVDKLSPVLKSITGNVREGVQQTGLLTKALEGGFGSGQKAAGSLATTIRDSVLQANLLTQALNTGFGLASKAANSLMSGIQGAAASQTDVIKSVGSLAETIKVPYNVAEKLNADITGGLAEYAAALPGETDTYVRLFRSISDDVAMTNKEMNNGKFNTEQYTGQVTELTAKFAALGDGLSFGQLTNSLGGLLGGQSIASLKQLEFFEKNPVFLKRLQETLGSKDIKDLTSGERIETILKALNSSLTDDTIGRLGGTFDGAVQGMKTKLLDPNVGIFGLLRDLDKNAAGQQSAFEAINAATQALIGSDGLFFTLGDTLSVLGIHLGDPMQALRDTALWVGAKVRSINWVLKHFGVTFKDVGAEFAGNTLINKMGQIFKKTIADISGAFDFSQLGERVSNWFNIGIGLLSKIDTSFIGQKAGELLNTVFQEGKDFLSGVNWGAVAGVAINLTKNLVTSFFGALSPQLLNLAGAAFGAFAISQAVVVPLAAGLSQLITSAVSFALPILFPGLVAGFAGLPVILVAGAAVAIGLLVKAILDNWGDIYPIIADYFGSMFEVFRGGLEIMTGVITLNIPLIQQGLQNVTGGLKGLFDWAATQIDAVRASLGMTTSGQKSANAVADAAEAKYQKAAANSKVPNKASGFMPNTGLGALLSSAMREASAMPNSAGLMMANSSEAILNRGQQSLLAGALANRGGGGGLHIGGSIIIHTQATDAQGIAKDVMAEIANQYRAYQQSRLTAVS